MWSTSSYQCHRLVYFWSLSKKSKNTQTLERRTGRSRVAGLTGEWGMFPLASKDPIPAGWCAWIPKDGKPRLWKRRHWWCRLRTGKVRVEEVESELCKCLMMFDVWSCCGLLLVCLLGFGCRCCPCVVEVVLNGFVKFGLSRKLA